MTDHDKKSQPILRLSNFTYDYPPSLVAQHPLKNREDSKLLVSSNSGTSHHLVKELAELVPENTIFIVNDSRVISSRIPFKTPQGGAGELLLLEPQTLSPSASPDVEPCESWLALARPVKKLKIGQVIDLGHDLQATITNLPDQSKDGVQPIKVAFSLTGQSLLKWLENYGEVPLPPYISRKHAPHDSKAEDQTRYQTIYAGLNGSVAAPTAGLHFSKALIEQLKIKGCEIHPITLHVGAGTFLPVKTQTIADHTMHSERFMINKSTFEAMSSAKALGRTVVLVGTTTFRAIEGFKEITHLTKEDPLELADTWQRTGIFIHPKTKEDRYEPWFGDALMTNFHQPESTLLMLVSAIFGYSRIQEIYKEAVAKSYRLFSYGDSSLLWFKS